MTGSGTSGRHPLQRFTAPVRRGRCPHIAPPGKCAFCGRTHGSRPTGYAGHAGWDVGTPSPTTVHRTHPQGDDAHTSPRRANAHFAAGHMGPALQGTPVMQDGTSGRRPLQWLTVPVRMGDDAHIAPPDKCAFCGGTHGSRPTGYAGHAGRDVGTPSPTTAHRTRPQEAMPTHRPADSIKRQAQAAGDWTRKGTLTVPFHTILPSDICDRTGSLTG